MTHLTNLTKTNQRVSTLFAHHHFSGEMEVVCMEFRPRSCHHHHPRMQERDGGGVLCCLTPFVLPPPSHARAKGRWDFNPIHAATTSLACKSEKEVGFMSFHPRSCRRHLACNSKTGKFYVISTLFASSPPSHARARRRWIFMSFRPRWHRHHLLHGQERIGGGFYVASTPFASPPSPSHARVSRRCIFEGFRPRSRCRHFPHVQQKVGCGLFLTPRPGSHCCYLPRMQQQVRGGIVWYGLWTLFAPPPPPSHATASRFLSGS